MKKANMQFNIRFAILGTNKIKFQAISSIYTKITSCHKKIMSLKNDVKNPSLISPERKKQTQRDSMFLPFLFLGSLKIVCV